MIRNSAAAALFLSCCAVLARTPNAEQATPQTVPQAAPQPATPTIPAVATTEGAAVSQFQK
ncbi:MAG: hypothetical protein ACLQHF_00210, partial [Terracidiphilus sp.]